MKSGKDYKFGDIFLAHVQFIDSGEIKTRPALVLFEEYGNIVIVGITSNPHTKGISITKEEGMEVDSVIKLNYIMTISEKQVKKYLFTVSNNKKQEVKQALLGKYTLN